MASFNRVVLVGNATRDVELRKVSGGYDVCDLGLAVNDRRKDSMGNWVEEATFVDVTIWGRTASIAAEYVRRGTQVLIEGRLKMDTWETDGQKKSKLRVVCERLVLLGRAPGSSGGGYSGGGYSNSNYSAPQAPRQTGYPDAPPPFDPASDVAGDDIPF